MYRCRQEVPQDEVPNRKAIRGATADEFSLVFASDRKGVKAFDHVRREAVKSLENIPAIGRFKARKEESIEKPGKTSLTGVLDPHSSDDRFQRFTHMSVGDRLSKPNRDRQRVAGRRVKPSTLIAGMKKAHLILWGSIRHRPSPRHR